MDEDTFKDARMEKVDESIAINYFKSLPGNWIYIKNINNSCFREEKEQVTTYTKFRVRNVTIDNNTILIYGIEDRDRVTFDKKFIYSYQMTPMRDEIYIQIIIENNNIDVYIQNYLPNIKTRLNEILETDQNLIITEGKTDWKHLKRALRCFQKDGFYRDLNFKFFEYENEMGARKLRDVLNYNCLFYSKGIKIFIFDADLPEINKLHNKKEYIDWGNNIYSFTIPVPDFRKQTPLVCIENYYNDKEIKMADINGRRLYLNGEFDAVTGVLNSDNRILDAEHGKHKKKPENHVIDDKIFKVPEEIEICDKNILQIKNTCKNIALSKNDFANYILNSEEPFNSISHQNFKYIFDIIEKIQMCPRKNVYKEENFINVQEIEDGVYIKRYLNNLETLEICLKETEEIKCIVEDDFLLTQIYLDKKENIFFINIYNSYNKKYEIPISIGQRLLEFLQEKADNQYNRIELHIVNEQRDEVKVVEILKDDIVGGLIQRELCRFYDEN